MDYNLSDKWRMYAHFSRFNTRLGNPNWSDNRSIAVATWESIMDAMSSGMDVLYMANPRTTLDIRLGVNYIEDDCCTNPLPNLDVWKNLWPNSDWYVPLNNAAVGIFFPGINWSGIGGGSAGYGSWWYDHLRVYEPSITLTHELGKHHMKIGWQWRHGYTQNFLSEGPGGLNFNSIDTGSTFLSNYNPSVDGDQWASILLGAVDSGIATIFPVAD